MALSNTALVMIEEGFKAADKLTSAAELAKGAKIAGAAGDFLGAAGLLLTVADALLDPKGPQTKHTVDFAIGLISFVPGIGTAVGVGWFVANLASEAINHKSLSENIQNIFVQ
jgi:hypothetical protein